MYEEYIHSSLIFLSLIPAWRLHSLLKAKRFISLIPNLMFISSLYLLLDDFRCLGFCSISQTSLPTAVSLHLSSQKLETHNIKCFKYGKKLLLPLIKAGKLIGLDQVTCSLRDTESFRSLFPCLHMKQQFRNFMLIYFLTLNKT